MKKKKSAKRKNPKDRALTLLSYRSYTCHELKKRLEQDGYSPEKIEEVISWLVEIGYLDDQVTAKFYVENRNRFRPTGIYGLKRELDQKGVDPEIIDSVINSPQDDYRLALKLAKKRLEQLQHISTEKQYRRIGGLLQRRGFGWDTVHGVLRTLFNSSLDSDL